MDRTAAFVARSLVVVTAAVLIPLGALAGGAAAQPHTTATAPAAGTTDDTNPWT